MFTPRGRKDDGSEWLVVKFQDNSISLDIPRGGVVLESGWKISPMAHPGVRIFSPCEYQVVIDALTW